jgi:hypothetical protein
MEFDLSEVTIKQERAMGGHCTSEFDRYEIIWTNPEGLHVGRNMCEYVRVRLRRSRIALLAILYLHTFDLSEVTVSKNGNWGTLYNKLALQTGQP